MKRVDIPVMLPRAVQLDFLVPRLRSIEASGVFSNGGPQVLELEERLADFLHVDRSRVVVTSNATVGLMAALALSPAKKWQLGGWSFPASAQAPLLMNLNVKLCDIDPNTWEALDRRESENTGLINVIPFGAEIRAHSLSYPGELVVDAAASLASGPKLLNQLGESQVVVFSLHATKALAGAEGGLIVFGSSSRAARARSWINFGLAGSRNAQFSGINGKMSEYDAAVANARLDGWSDENAEWQRLRMQSLETYGQLGLEKTPDAMNAVGPYWVALFENSRRRDKAASLLERKGIQTRLWWGAGLHRMPAFAGLERSNLSTIDSVANRYLGLPFFLGMGRDTFGHIAEAILVSK